MWLGLSQGRGTRQCWLESKSRSLMHLLAWRVLTIFMLAVDIEFLFLIHHVVNFQILFC